MARTRPGRRLTDLHKNLQDRIAAETVSALEVLWRLLTVDGDLTEDEWTDAVVMLLSSRHQVSQQAARSYYQAFRTAETGVLEQVRQFGTRAFRTEHVAARAASYPDYYQTLIDSGLTPGEAGARAGRELTGELVEQVLDGGRMTVIDTVQTDGRATGWYRVSDGDPCAFCALLVARGVSYKTETTASFNAHWKCGCSAEPSYTNDRFRDDASKELYDFYRKSTRGHADKLNAFRRAYERPGRST